MAFDRETLRLRVNARLQDDANQITNDELEHLIDSAINVLQKDSPLELVYDIAGDGTQDYDLGANFVDRYSIIEAVEMPAGMNPPIFKDIHDDWIFYEDPSEPVGQRNRLRFLTVTPQATETIRVTITALYTFTDASSNLDPVSFAAVGFKVLEFAYKALASKNSQTADPTILADTVDRGSAAQNYLILMENCRAAYKRQAGLATPTKAASALVEGDIRFWTGEDMFWHPARTR